MGAEESKGANYGLMRPSAVVTNMNRQVQAARAWSLLHMCSIEQWKSGHAEAAGFSETTMTCSGVVFKDCSPTFCTSRQGIINISKSSSVFSFRRRSKFTKMAEHFEYNHIPAQLSSIQNFHVKSVLCYQEQTVVLHLVRNMATLFGVIDLASNKFLGVFGKQNVEFVNEALRGEISPDGTMCLIKLPHIKSASTGVFVFQLYHLKSKTKIREVTLQHQHSLFAFDPRFSSSRIAATSFKRGEDNSLSLVRTDVDTWDILATNPRVDGITGSLYPTLKDLFYSKDGQMIFVVMVTSGCHCKDRKTRRYQPIEITVSVFNADTTQSIHIIQYNRYTCGLHSCPINYMPVFSNCGSRMAIILNDMETTYDHVQIYKLPTWGNLQNRCRIRILQTYPLGVVPKLPLPSRLIQYLQYQPEFA